MDGKTNAKVEIALADCVQNWESKLSEVFPPVSGYPVQDELPEWATSVHKSLSDIRKAPAFVQSTSKPKVLLPVFPGTNCEMDMARGKEDERLMVSIANPETVEPLVNMALMMRNPKSKKELLAVTVEVEYDEAKKQAKLAQRRKSLEHAARIASAVDVPMKTRCRLSTNAATGILNTASEMNATEIVLGLHHKHGLLDSFLGSFAQSILKGTHRQLMIVKCLMPVNTMRRIMVAVPPKAEYESGFYKWVERISRIGGQLGCRVHFWAHPDTIQRINGYVNRFHSNLRVEFTVMDDWDDLLLMSSKIAYDHLTVIVSARKGAISYQSSFEELPNQITRYFSNSSLILIYPDQLGDPLENYTFSSPRSQAENRIYNNVLCSHDKPSIL